MARAYYIGSMAVWRHFTCYIFFVFTYYFVLSLKNKYTILYYYMYSAFGILKINQLFFIIHLMHLFSCDRRLIRNAKQKKTAQVMFRKHQDDNYFYLLCYLESASLTVMVR